MAEGEGFEPPVRLPVRLISSQVPLTTQPPFHLVKSRTRFAPRVLPDKVWQKSQYANLVRYVPSGIYFARTRIGGKLIRRSPRTKRLGVAKLKLADLEKEEWSKLENIERIDEGNVVFKDLVAEYRARFEAKPHVEDFAAGKSWPARQSRVPLLHVCDKTDPWFNDHTRVVEQRYKELGGQSTRRCSAPFG
jgi:hypothetical protein